jgi:hypothetical protein
MYSRAHDIGAAIIGVILWAGTLSSPALAEEITFALEPTVKATTFSNAAIPEGTKLSFLAKDFKPNETLLLQRCGEPCNTAKVVRIWRADELVGVTPKEVVVSEAGRYYFWIRKQLPNGETGPVLGEFAESRGKATTVRYASGSVVTVTISNE